MALFFNRQAPKIIWANRTRARRIWVNRQFAFQDEVVATINAHTAQIVLPGSYFSAADWTNPLLRKRLVITNGAHVWSYTQGVPALDLGTGRQGDLYVDVHAGAYVLGHNGSRNSGVGGTAIKVRQNLCWLNNAGGVYGGGGGGGRGGNGGAGYYYDYQNSGWLYSMYSYHWEVMPSNRGAITRLYFGGGLLWETGAENYGPVDISGWRYHRGTQMGTNGSWYFYQIRRELITPNAIPTAGGPGGFGGQGSGYNSGLGGMSESGGAGSAGGLNAGAGGTGAPGGGWGAWGGTGNTGAAGNGGSGLAGAAGGAPGFYVDGYANLNGFTNTGSALGRQQ